MLFLGNCHRYLDQQATLPKAPTEVQGSFLPFPSSPGVSAEFCSCLASEKNSAFLQRSMRKIANTGVDSTIRRRMARIQDAMRFDIEVC